MTVFSQTISFAWPVLNQKLRSSRKIDIARPVALKFSSAARKRMGWLQFLSRGHY